MEINHQGKELSSTERIEQKLDYLVELIHQSLPPAI